MPGNGCAADIRFGGGKENRPGTSSLGGSVRLCRKREAPPPQVLVRLFNLAYAYCTRPLLAFSDFELNLVAVSDLIFDF